MKQNIILYLLSFVLCSCGSDKSQDKAKKFDEDIVKQDLTEYREYIRLGRQLESLENFEDAANQYEYALEIEFIYSDTEYSDWFYFDAAGCLNEVRNALLSGTHCAHEWIDLGLPSGLKWATCNVGASRPEEYGDYYPWGEIETIVGYRRRYSKWFDVSKNAETRYNKAQLDSSDDVATVIWGGEWRMPTKLDFQELIDNCNWILVTRNSHKCYEAISKINGKSIYFPFAGGSNSDENWGIGKYGLYWSSTPDESNTCRAYCLFLGSSSQILDRYGRYNGLSVRPVMD